MAGRCPVRAAGCASRHRQQNDAEAARAATAEQNDAEAALDQIIDRVGGHIESASGGEEAKSLGRASAFGRPPQAR